LLEDHARATRRVQIGERAIARARKVIAEAANGYDVAGFEELLVRLEEFQKMHIEYLERIRRELEEPLPGCRR
jgi:hypothetical protein